MEMGSESLVTFYIRVKYFNVLVSEFREIDYGGVYIF